MHKQLFDHLGTIVPLSESLRNVLSQLLLAKEFKKRTCLLNEGEVSNYIFFIEKGLVKTYYKEGETEISTSFIKENEVVISVRSFFTRQPSAEIIEALEDTVVHYLHYDDLQKIYQSHVEFNIIGRILAEKHYVTSEERLFFIRKKKADERFNLFFRSHPWVTQRVSRKDIASYLGISDRSISRIGHTKK